MPLHAPLAPALEPFSIRSRLHEELHLHLLEFAGSEDEVARRDLISKRLADLRDSERDLLPRGLKHVQIIHIDALGRFRPQVHDRRGILDWSHEGLEHQVEHSRLGQRAAGSTHRTLRVRLARCPFDSRVVRAKSVLALPAVDQRIREARHMTRRFPYPRMHEDRRIQSLDVIPGAAPSSSTNGP